jgi:hypothetical protein
MNKNTSVETTKNGQATKVPTGKVKTIKSKEEIRKAKEQEYENRRVNALKRRAKRMGMSEEQINECVEKLKKQLKEPNQYSIHVIFHSGMEDMAVQALKNAKINCKLLILTKKKETFSWALIEGDQSVLAKVRETIGTFASIHPYAKKFESVLPKSEPIKVKKPSNNTAEAKKAAKERRKFANVSRNTNRTKRSKKTAFTAKRERLAKAKKDRKANVIHLQKTKRSTGSKKASTSLKKAA